MLHRSDCKRNLATLGITRAAVLLRHHQQSWDTLIASFPEGLPRPFCQPGRLVFAVTLVIQAGAKLLDPVIASEAKQSISDARVSVG